MKQIYPPYWFFDDVTKPITLGKYNMVFESIDRDFNEFWGNDVRKHWSSKEAHWKRVLEFITKYTHLTRGLITEEYGVDIDKPRVSCMIETLQNYDNFEIEHIIQLLEGLGKLANLMYCAERDVLIGNHVLAQRTDYPLESSYVSALEQIVWMIASFAQGEHNGGFTDLITRLKQINDRKHGGSTE